MVNSFFQIVHKCFLRGEKRTKVLPTKLHDSLFYDGGRIAQAKASNKWTQWHVLAARLSLFSAGDINLARPSSMPLPHYTPQLLSTYKTIAGVDWGLSQGGERKELGWQGQAEPRRAKSAPKPPAVRKPLKQAAELSTSRLAKPAWALSRVGANDLRGGKKEKRNPPPMSNYVQLEERVRERNSGSPRGSLTFVVPSVSPWLDSSGQSSRSWRRAVSVWLSRQDVVMSSSLCLKTTR